MKHVQPRGLNRRRVQQLLLAARHQTSTGGRIALLSRRLLGHPYKPNPLIGSAERAEVFTVSLDGLDCVTYIETVLALARATNVAEFVEWLRKIRYDRGRVQWKLRNHYMTFWIRNNIRNGVLRPLLLPNAPTVSRRRVLNVVPGLAARPARVRCVPKLAVSRLEAHLQSGDLMFFVSSRRNLDMFHAGIVMRDGERVVLRHASRSRGLVVEQELCDFLKANRMAGVVVVRPRGTARR
jgi:hypothetical protein